jgi:hypothetical protein
MKFEWQPFGVNRAPVQNAAIRDLAVTGVLVSPVQRRVLVLLIELYHRRLVVEVVGGVDRHHAFPDVFT